MIYRVYDSELLDLHVWISILYIYIYWRVPAPATLRWEENRYISEGPSEARFLAFLEIEGGKQRDLARKLQELTEINELCSLIESIPGNFWQSRLQLNSRSIEWQGAAEGGLWPPLPGVGNLSSIGKGMRVGWYGMARMLVIFDD